MVKTMEKVEIYIPLKVSSNKIKTIVGPIARIAKNYYLALSLVTPDPFKPRWEPHIVIDKNSLLRDNGFYKLTGYISLIKTQGLDAYMRKLVREGYISNYHLAAWGTPLMVVVATTDPLPVEETALKENKGLILLKKIVSDAKNFHIIEV